MMNKFLTFWITTTIIITISTIFVPGTVLALNSSDCSHLSNDEICFGGITQLDVQVMENRERVVVASLGRQDCEDKVQLNYAVSMTSREHKDVFRIQQSKNTSVPFELWVRGNLDREFIAVYNFTLICTIKFKNESSGEHTLPGSLIVQDEDDNGPVTFMKSSQATVYISLHPDKNKVTPGSRLKPDGNYTELTFEDKDSLDVNNYDIIKVNDTRDLLQIKWQHHQLNHKGTPSTFGIVQAVLGANRIGLWEGLYCVVVIVNDTTLTVSTENSKVTFNICLHLGNEPVQPQLLKKNKMDGVKQPGSVCGANCVVAILLSAFFLLVTSIGFVLLWKFRSSRKSRPVKSCPALINNGGVLVPGGFGNHLGNINGNLISDLDYMRPGHTAFTYEYMPVDLKWELPRSSLMLQEILGEGEFGRVHRAKFQDPSDPQGRIVDVAVKILKDDPLNGKCCRQEFMAEFSLLKQVDHLNVIKLIGACTGGGEPPYLIMEYCEFKALKSFLRKCRRIEVPHCPSSFLMTDVPLSRSDQESVWEPYSVTPREIIGFSWQIAKGMAYLSEMKMVHRDLAARNILLTCDKICKISDFGLTRDVYVDDAYKKKSKDKVPVKWLALECLSDEVYTTKSDVWAFGILMWELINLGASPYPGIPSEQLYTLLRNDYRMPRPEGCSDELYGIMKSCWENEPSNRPTFRLLVDSLGKLLEVGEDYLQVNINLVSNPGYGFNPVAANEVTPLHYSSNNTSAVPHESSSEAQVPDGLMENLRLIENEISTCGGGGDGGGCESEFRGVSSFPSNTLVHSYINHPRRSKILSDMVSLPVPNPGTGTTITNNNNNHTTLIIPPINSTHYESPIKRRPESLSSS